MTRRWSSVTMQISIRLPRKLFESFVALTTSGSPLGADAGTVGQPVPSSVATVPATVFMSEGNRPS